MSEFSGMDVDQVRTLARDLDHQAQTIDHLVATIDHLVDHASHYWNSSHRREFQDWWHSQHRPRMRAVAGAVHGLAASARNNADQQDHASTSSASVPRSVGGTRAPHWPPTVSGFVGFAGEALGLAAGASELLTKPRGVMGFFHEVSKVPAMHAVGLVGAGVTLGTGVVDVVDDVRNGSFDKAGLDTAMTGSNLALALGPKTPFTFWAAENVKIWSNVIYQVRHQDPNDWDFRRHPLPSFSRSSFSDVYWPTVTDVAGQIWDVVKF